MSHADVGFSFQCRIGIWLFDEISSFTYSIIDMKSPERFQT
ncbi:MAG: hypothetical protein ACLFSQ_06240 [Candidatus Zixiibacteriota bacterium]